MGIRNSLIDLLFPKKCLACGQIGCWLCSDCEKKIIVEKIFYCPRCLETRNFLEVCPDCRAGSFLDGLYVIAPYHDQLVSKTIKLIKYNLAWDLAEEVITKYFRDYFVSNNYWDSEYFLTPIPLHQRRYLERGFNQAELIAKILEQTRGNKLSETYFLKRKKYNPPQAKLSGQARRNNVKDIFQVDNHSYLNKKILLIDDVYTTGATMQEAAKALKESGIAKVYGLALAKG